MTKRSKHSLSHTVKLTCNPGELVPVGCVEVLPGDVFNHSTGALVRTLPLLAPLMHKMEVRFHHWFVPTRLIWVDFENFITGGPDGDDSSVPPTISIPNGGFAVGSLADYLGLPTGMGDSINVSALPFRAYALTYNQWYRDQDLQIELPISLASGGDVTTSLNLQRIGWEKDYFTSARPWAQKGSDVTISLTGDAPVVTNNAQPVMAPIAGSYTNGAMTLTGTGISVTNNGGNLGAMKFGSVTGLKATLSGLSAITVRQLREALSLQRFMEHRARFGSRYVDYLQFLGIRPQDSRIQLPEYLGGGSSPLQFSEVLQTARDAGDPNGVGNLRGHGIGAVRANAYRRMFPEHGYVLTLMSVRPKTAYMQGIGRMWSRQTKEDYWQKELEHTGQMAILNKEIYADHSHPDSVFGYQDNYDDYRFIESRVSGDFRTSLNFWHMATEYGSDPALNSSFVKCLPTDRVYAVTEEGVDKLQVQVIHSLQARRIISRKGTSFTM